MEVYALLVLVTLFIFMALFAYDLGSSQSRRDRDASFEKCNRYLYAVYDLDKWCGQEFPQARLIASHLLAIGEGWGLNAGTPCADEPCTIQGLREQLRRIDASEQGKD